MSKLKFTIEAQHWQARAGTIFLNGIEVKTPVFMPVGTKATIKWILLSLLQDDNYLWELDDINIILSNTFHLYLRPWEDLIRDAWWIQKFMRRPGLVLTDSWWFQVFSLWLNKAKKSQHSKKWPLISLQEEGIKFKSPIDGSSHFMSPEDAVDIQSKLGSDIMMMLDICSPGWASDAVYYRQLQQTHRWAQRQFDYYQSKKDALHWVLFPIVQWGTNKQMRQESIDFLSQFADDWIAVWGVSVGESREAIKEVVEFCWDKLPSHIPRYLMWVGDLETIELAVRAWFDMFDCVMPTRFWRHGLAYTNEGIIHITNARFRSDHSLLRAEAKNNVSKMYTKSYIHHLFREKEMLWGILLSLHNIFYLHEFMQNLREKIIQQDL